MIGIVGKLKLVTAPAVEPVSLSEALEQCHVDEGIEDEWFASTIVAARIEAEDYQRRAYVHQVYDYYFDTLPTLSTYQFIDIPRPPLVEVASVTLYDADNVEHVVDLSNFYIDTDTQPGRIAFAKNGAWPSIDCRAINCLKIRFTAGYSVDASLVPESIKKAVKLYVSHFYNNRAAEVTKIPAAFYDVLKSDRMYQ